MTNLLKLTTEYLDFCQYQRKLDEKTIKAYRIDLLQFSQFVLDHNIDLDKTSISTYIRHLHSKYKPKSVKRKIASVRAFFNYHEFEGTIHENPMDKLRLSFKEPVTLPKTMSWKTVQKLLRTAHSSLPEVSSEWKRKSILRDIAVLELLFATGLRVSELCSIEQRHINLRDGSLKVLGKGSRERIVFITNQEVLSALRQYKNAFVKQINETGWFFINRLGRRLSEQSVRSMIQIYAKKAKIAEHITPHMMRHSFATLLLEEDVDIRYIQSLLGHSSITTTQIYTYASIQKQKKIVLKKHPRNRMTL